jgi:hypothetical protein
MDETFSESNELSKIIDSILASTSLREVTSEDLELIKNDMAALNSRAILRSISKRDKTHWEDGWNENYLKIISGELNFSDSLVPAYFVKQKYFRYQKKLYYLDSWTLLQKVHNACLQFAAKKAIEFHSHDLIIEVGSGSGQNLLELSSIFPNSKIIGADWSNAACRIADYLGAELISNGRGKDFGIYGQFFDFFNPESLEVSGAVVYTIHALEQIGTNRNFLNYLLSSKVGLVVSIEPIVEHYSENSILGDELITLHAAKEYLTGYPSWLSENVKLGVVEILYETRIDFGTLTAEPYSIYFWRLARTN